MLLACQGLMSPLTSQMSSNGDMTINSLLRLTQMTLDECIPELFDMAVRGAASAPSLYDDMAEDEEGSKCSRGLHVEVRAENDPPQWDRDPTPPISIETPRTVCIGYLDRKYDNDLDADEIEFLRRRLASARRAGMAERERDIDSEILYLLNKKDSSEDR